MERKTQELVDSSSGIESSRKRKQLYQLDGYDSSDSSTSKDAYKPRRRKTEKNGSGGEQKYCHQCKRNDKGHVVTRNRCERKRYCTSCISKDYPGMNEENFVMECPFCRDICNCKSCLRLELPEKNETRISEEAKKHYAKYLLRRLLPFVKQINEEQSLEKEMEAQIRGLPSSEVKVQQADCYVDERLNWRIPSHLQQGFLALRRDLPDLTSRAYELHKEVNRGMVMPLARSKEREELKSMLGKYRQIEENMVKLEKEKDTTMLSISRLQMRNEQLNEEVTNLRTAAENDVGDRSKLCNDEAWKLEEKIDHNSAEIVRLQATNEAIGAKLVKFSDEAKRLHKDAHAQHYKVLNLEAMAAAYERNVENTMDKLVIMEQNWKQQVQALDY